MADKSILEFYEAHARACDPKDFWSQVKRTKGGVPVGEDQIQLIVAAIVSGLALKPDDVVLDVCCGNGALSEHIFDRCRGGLGVDLSEYLIDIARQNFAGPDRRFQVGDAVEFLASTDDTERFTKALCYGSFSHFPAADGARLLALLRERFAAVTNVFVGNTPDKARMSEFWATPGTTYDPDDHRLPIGIWRTEAEFRRLAATAGWHARFSRMPEGFYGSRYRYDVILTRAG